MLETKQQEWENNERERESKESQEVQIATEEKIKGNISNVRSTMFKNRLPLQKKAQSGNKNTSEMNTSSSSSHDEKVENARALVTSDDIKRIYLSEGWDGITEVRVKLIVTAISLHNPPGVLKDTFVRLAGIAKLGVVHTAVQIGPIILEWNDSSILIPSETQEWASSKVLLALDMKTLSMDDFFRKFIGPVSDVVANWNGTYIYNEYTNNCQLFTEEVLKAMEIENVFTGKIKKFLDSVGTADGKDLVFKHKFDNDQREYEFRTHSELDETCHLKSSLLMSTDSEDYRLLKAYDRVFWLRYHGVSMSENLAKEPTLQRDLMNRFKPASTCFFGDPTGSNTHYPKTPSLTFDENETKKATLVANQMNYK